ncbi:phosphate ABC transporter ATP-binding protein [Candidatus Borrarchaeum sp.]|uniref:ABC transporter ATP-binding protein n=1 Tax=Candidatus Borrarchaeum sp. TaxID=2846742 RepID=UPI00257A9FCB|nr:phosphate ABC transporter ATP-binding protein [Candidatus Borrarchaeum sp.]
MTLLKVSNLSKKYVEKYAIKDISFELEQRKFFTLIGPSGAGKTTLLRLINLLEPPTSGEIEYNGWSLKTLHKKKMVNARREMGFVFQRPVVFSTTVKANVAYGLNFRNLPSDEIEERVHRALDMVGLHGFEERKALTLSGGEIQRVALARTLATEPKMLLLDEATADLDPANVALIESVLKKFNEEKKVTIIMATHNFFQAKRLGALVGFMMGGEMIEIGTADQIFNHPQDERTEAFISGEMIY